jgi:hypothetical protein
MDELLRFQLIRQEGREIWVHRVVQEAMNYHTFDEFQESFDSASRLVYEAFPKQKHDDFIQDRAACQSYISHGAHLSLLYSPLVFPETEIKGYDRPPPSDNSDQTSLANSKNYRSPYFIDLLSNCAWYLFVVSDYDMCLKMVETAWSACEDKDSLKYALLCHTAGSAYYELNRLTDCRKHWTRMMEIRAALLPEDDLEVSDRSK